MFAVLAVWNLRVLSLLTLPVGLKLCRIKDLLNELTALSELNRVWTGYTVTGENSQCSVTEETLQCPKP